MKIKSKIENVENFRINLKFQNKTHNNNNVKIEIKK